MSAIANGLNAVQEWMFSTEPTGLSHTVVAPTTTGITVTPTKALGVGAYWACLQNISSDLAKLPIGVYRREAEGRSRRIFTGDIWRMLNAVADDALTAYSMRQTSMQWTMGEGNAIAEIITTVGGKPKFLKLIEPARVNMDRVTGNVVYHVSGSVNDSTRTDPIDLAPEEVVHFKGMGSGYWGYPMLRFQAECLATSLATQQFANRFFANGTMAGSVISHPQEVQGEGYLQRLQANIVELRQKENQQKTLILEEGGTYTPMGTVNRDSQFIEIMGFTVREIASWFRMPLHMIQNMDGAKFNNVEMTGIEYVKDALLMWAVMIEQELCYKLFHDADEFYVEHDFSALMRGDSKARAEYFKARHGMGSLTGNEIREKEGDPRGPDYLDEYHMQLNMTTVKAISEGKNLKDETERDEDGFPKKDAAGQPPAKKSEESVEDEPEGEGVDAEFDVASFCYPLFVDSANLVMAKEEKAIKRKLAKESGNGNIAKEISLFYSELEHDIENRFATLYGKLDLPEKGLANFARHYASLRNKDIITALKDSDVAKFHDGVMFATKLYAFVGVPEQDQWKRKGW